MREKHRRKLTINVLTRYLRVNERKANLAQLSWHLCSVCVHLRQ